MKVKNGSTPLESTVSAERRMENRLRDLLLDIEDRIYQGTLGSLKVFWPATFLLGFNVISCSHLKSKQTNWFTLKHGHLCHYTLSESYLSTVPLFKYGRKCE